MLKCDARFAGLQGHIAILKCSAILLFQNCITNRQLKFIMQGQGLIHKICQIYQSQCSLFTKVFATSIKSKLSVFDLWTWSTIKWFNLSCVIVALR